jgi:hypothetical protein
MVDTQSRNGRPLGEIRSYGPEAIEGASISLVTGGVR